jgi:hypothetical protein
MRRFRVAFSEESSMSFKPRSLSLLLIPLLASATQLTLAHSARDVFDPLGDRAEFTALARATCSDNGSGAPASLTVRIRDNSAPEAGQYLSLHLLRGTQAISITDTTPGDAAFSDHIAIVGGPGVYTVMMTHTRAGARDFDIEYHCLTADGAHAGTSMIVDQFQ